MLRRDSTPSPPLGCGDDIGASPTGVIGLWDSSNWSKPFADPLETKEEGDELSYQDMLGEAALLPGEGLEDSDTGKDDSLLQMGGTAWSDACLVAVQLSMDGTTIGGKMASGEDETLIAEGGARAGSAESPQEGTEQGEQEGITVKFSMEAPTDPMEDGINLGDETRQTFPLKLEVPPSFAACALKSSSSATGAAGADANEGCEKAPPSPLSAQTEEDRTGITDLASLDVMGLESDDPLSALSHDFSPDDLSSTPSGDPTGGVDDPFDEDYCGWLAEEI